VSSALGTSDKAGADLASKIISLVGQEIKTGASASASYKEKRQLSEFTGLASSLEKSLISWASIQTYDVAEAEKAWKALEAVSTTLAASGKDAATKLAGEIISKVDKSIKAGVKAAGSKEKMQLSDLKNLASSIASSFAAKAGSADALALAEAEKVCYVLTSVASKFEASKDAGAKVAGKIVSQVEESLKAAAAKAAIGIKKRQLPGLPDLSSLTSEIPGLSGGESSSLPDISAILAGLPLPLPGLEKRQLPGLPDLSSLTGSSSALPEIPGLSGGLPDISDLLSGLSLPGLEKRQLPDLPLLSGLTSSGIPEIPDLPVVSDLPLLSEISDLIKSSTSGLPIA
jgi:hypothetical protein